MTSAAVRAGQAMFYVAVIGALATIGVMLVLPALSS